MSRERQISKIIARVLNADSAESNCVSQDPSAPPLGHCGGKWKPNSSTDVCIRVADDRFHQTLEEKTHITPLTVSQNSTLTATISALKTPVNCSLCGRDFPGLQSMMYHLLSQSHRNSMTCNNASQAAELYTANHKHLSSWFSFICHCCRFVSNTHRDLICHIQSAEHRDTVGKLVGPLMCKPCGFLDYDGSSMLGHLLLWEEVPHNSKVVLKEKRHRIKCTQCDAVLYATSHYAKHCRGHARAQQLVALSDSVSWCPDSSAARNQQTPFVKKLQPKHACEVCGDHFGSKYDRNRHYFTKRHCEEVLEVLKVGPTAASVHSVVSCVPGECPSVLVHGRAAPGQSSSRSKVMRCKYCLYSTDDMKSLQEHYRKQHEGITPDTDNDCYDLTPCQFCSRLISCPKELFLHEVDHLYAHKLASRGGSAAHIQLECIFCFRLLTQETLASHLLKHSYCSKTKPASRNTSYSSAIGKTGNLAKTIAKEPVFRCSVPLCNKAYRYKSGLNQHKQNHNGMKTILCEHCNKGFPTKKHLRAHSHTHSAEKPFGCEYCSYRSKTQCHMSRHTRIHAGSKPYQCPHCDYSCTTVGNLRKHVLQSTKHRGCSMYECKEPNCCFTSNTAAALSKHLLTKHITAEHRVSLKTPQNDFIDVPEGEHIIPVQSKADKSLQRMTDRN